MLSKRSGTYPRRGSGFVLPQITVAFLSKSLTEAVPEQTCTTHPLTHSSHTEAVAQSSTKHNFQPDRQHYPQLWSLIFQLMAHSKPQLRVAAGLRGDIYSWSSIKSGGYVKLQHPSDCKRSPAQWGNGWRLVTARSNWSVWKYGPGITGLMLKFQLGCIVPFPPALQQQRHAFSSGDQKSFIKLFIQLLQQRPC